MTTSIKKNRRGALLITIPLFIIILIVVGGLAIDYGNFQVEKSRLQSAADAGAIAAAMRLANGFSLQGMYDALNNAANFAKLNERENGLVLTADPMEFGTWDYDTSSFVPTYTRHNINAIRLTVRCGSGENKGISTYFMSFFGVREVEASKTAIAVMSPTSFTNVVPMALRDTFFSAVDPNHQYVEIPSRPRGHYRFGIGGEVDVAMYGYNTPTMHLALAFGANGPNASSSEVKKILSAESDPVPMQIGEMVPVFDQGIGNGGYGQELEKRLNFPEGSPERLVVLPVIEQVLGTRNFQSKLVGDVRIGDFVAIKLTRTATRRLYDPTIGRVVDSTVLKGRVVGKLVSTSKSGIKVSGVGSRTVSIVELVH